MRFVRSLVGWFVRCNSVACHKESLQYRALAGRLPELLFWNANFLMSRSVSVGFGYFLYTTCGCGRRRLTTVAFITRAKADNDDSGNNIMLQPVTCKHIFSDHIWHYNDVFPCFCMHYTLCHKHTILQQKQKLLCLGGGLHSLSAFCLVNGALISKVTTRRIKM